MLRIRKNLLSFAVALVLTAAFLLAMSPRVMAATLTTSIGDSEWPTYCGVGQTRNIVAQILPNPPTGFTYLNCSLTIIMPDGANTIIANASSDSLGYVRFSYAPHTVGTYHIGFSFPGQVIPPYSSTPDIYTPVSSTGHIWVVGPSPDTTPPTGTILINGGAPTTTSQSVLLSLYASDTQSEVWTMRFSNGDPWSIWEKYNTVKSWNLTPGAGLKTVYVQFKDENENPSINYTAQIILIGSSPLVVSASPSSVSVATNQSGVFAASASGGTPSYSYQWFEGATVIGASSQLTISKSASGTYSFYCKVTDLVGSTADSNTVTMAVTAAIPSPTMTPTPATPTQSPGPSSLTPSPSSVPSQSPFPAIIIGSIAAVALGGASVAVYSILLSKPSSTMEVAKELDKKTMEQSMKEEIKERKMKPRKGKPHLVWSVSAPTTIKPDLSRAALEVQNRGVSTATNIQITVDSTTGVVLNNRAANVNELKPNEKRSIVFPFSTTSQARKGVYTLKFEIKGKQTPAQVKKRFVRLTRIGLLANPGNQVYATTFKNWLGMHSYVWEELASADDFLKLLKYDLIITAPESTLSPRATRNLSNFVEEGQSLLVVDKIITQEQEVLANALGYKKMQYETAKYKESLLTVVDNKHQITQGFNIGQTIPIGGFWGNICTSEFSTGQQLVAHVVKNEGENITIPAVISNTIEKGKAVLLNFHAEENAFQIDSLLKNMVEWLLSTKPFSVRESKPPQ